MRCISCLLSQTSNCIKLLQGKVLPPEVNQVLQKLKYALNTIASCFTPSPEDSSLTTQLTVSVANDTGKPNFCDCCLPESEECLETFQACLLGNQNQVEERLKEILVFSFQRYKLLLDQLVQEQDCRETDCTFDEEQYNFSVETKTNQALKLLRAMKKIIKELNSLISFNNLASKTKDDHHTQEKTTNYSTQNVRSSARSLLTEKLKNFHEEEKTQEENVIPCFQGKFVVKKNWNLNRTTSKEHISEPLNSISNVSDLDSESFGAYSLDYPRLTPKDRKVDQHCQRGIFDQITWQNPGRTEIPMSTSDNGCSKCQIY